MMLNRKEKEFEAYASLEGTAVVILCEETGMCTETVTLCVVAVCRWS